MRRIVFRIFFLIRSAKMKFFAKNLSYPKTQKNFIFALRMKIYAIHKYRG